MVPSLSINSLAPGKFEWHFRYVIFKQILVIDGWGISCEDALIWMSLDFADDQSTLVQVMAWCHQATSHYLSQCWPRSLSPYGITRPQWVNCQTLKGKSFWEANFFVIDSIISCLYDDKVSIMTTFCFQRNISRWTILDDVIQFIKVTCNHWYQVKLKVNHQYCACWWPSTFRC